jgi:hypothetical protein
VNRAGPGFRLAWVVMFGTPLLWAILSVVHPSGEGDIYAELQDQVGRWLFVHVAQVVLAPFLALAVWLLLRGIESLAATISRVALVFWLVFFSTYDALAGIATGVLVRQANSVSGEERAGFAEAADFLFDSHIGGNISWFALVAGGAWIIVAIAAAVALRGAGANWLTTVAAALSALFAFHAGYAAMVGLIALLVAAFLWERRRVRSGVAPQAAVPTSEAGG